MAFITARKLDSECNIILGQHLACAPLFVCLIFRELAEETFALQCQRAIIRTASSC